MNPEVGEKPFEGIRVVDLSRVLAGPYCGQILSDMGADVIKVESVGGDENRAWPPILSEGQSCNFGSVNRGKRSLTVDLKSEGGREILKRLTRWADVMLHSFLPATASRLGLDYETLKQVNERLVFCSISGYGEHGPLKDKPGYDLMVQAFSGAMSTTGYDGNPPTRIGVSYIDMSTGVSAYGGIAAALFRRERTGQGGWIRCSLLETSVSLLGYHGVAWLQAGVLPKRQGSGGVYQVPYQAFKCQDGYVMIGAPNNAAWARLCDAIGMPELGADERFQSSVSRVEQREVLIPLLERVLESRPVKHWVDLLERARVAVAPINSIDQVLAEPQVRANGMVLACENPEGGVTEYLASPFKLDDLPPVQVKRPPALGADTSEILRELEFGEDEIASLIGASGR